MSLKPWSAKKRLIVTTGVTLAILGLALIIGSSIYGLGRVVGLFIPQDLYAAVTREFLKDQNAVAKFNLTLNQKICLNPELGYQYNFFSRFKLTLASNPEAVCSELTLTNPQGGTSYIKIMGYPKPASTTINAFIGKLSQVKTSNFDHPLYPATLIEGFQNEIPVASIYLSPNEYSSWNILFYPANPVDLPLVEKLAKSFKLNDN